MREPLPPGSSINSSIEVVLFTTFNRIASITTIHRIAIITTVNRKAIITTINRTAIIMVGLGRLPPGHPREGALQLQV